MNFIKSAWCDEAAAALKGLIEPEVLPLFLQWIADGTATLWKVVGDGWVTWLVTRIELFPNGLRELVLDVIQGKCCKEILKILFERAKSVGVQTVRFETHHPEKIAQRFIGGLGFNRSATVFKAVL